MPTFQRQINTADDDTYFYAGDGHWYDNDTIVVLGSVWQDYCNARLRFTNLPISGAGQTIISARVKLYTGEDWKYPTKSVTIRMAKELNPTSPKTPSTWTTSSVVWTMPNPQAPNAWIYTPELKDLLTEVINQTGFARGNAVVVAINGQDAPGDQDNLFIVAYDTAPGSSAILEVVYSDKAGGAML